MQASKGEARNAYMLKYLANQVRKKGPTAITSTTAHVETKQRENTERLLVIICLCLHLFSHDWL